MKNKKLWKAARTSRITPLHHKKSVIMTNSMVNGAIKWARAAQQVTPKH